MKVCWVLFYCNESNRDVAVCFCSDVTCEYVLIVSRILACSRYAEQMQVSGHVAQPKHEVMAMIDKLYTRAKEIRVVIMVGNFFGNKPFIFHAKWR